jgi:hypothetical protein
LELVVHSIHLIERQCCEDFKRPFHSPFAYPKSQKQSTHQSLSPAMNVTTMATLVLLRASSDVAFAKHAADKTYLRDTAAASSEVKNLSSAAAAGSRLTA